MPGRIIVRNGLVYWTRENNLDRMCKEDPRETPVKKSGFLRYLGKNLKSNSDKVFVHRACSGKLPDRSYQEPLKKFRIKNESPKKLLINRQDNSLENILNYRKKVQGKLLQKYWKQKKSQKNIGRKFGIPPRETP